MHQVKGVIARAKGAPVTLETILVPDPGPGEALIDVHTCGVCRTDEHYMTGRIGNDYPYLLGHEATGTVAAIGPGEQRLSVGDLVVLNWRAVCGACRACEKGEPWYCFATHNATQKMTLTDGTPLTAALGIGAFAEKTLVAAGQGTRIDPALTPEQYAGAGLLGCGVMSGIGAAVRTGATRRGESVAVIGTGGVGMGAIAGARMAGASTIISIGRTDAKLRAAQELGATHTINAREVDAVAQVRELTGGFGADVVIDAVGDEETFLQALAARDHAGRMVLVGLPEPGAKITLPLDELFSRGGSIKPSWYGDTLPSRDIPAVVAEYLLGRIDLNAFVSERIGLDEVNKAFERMNRGEVLRSVVEINPRAV